MKKVNILGLVLLMVVVLLTALVVPAHAAWNEKITGGGQARVGTSGASFSITVSAWTSDGVDAGQMEYSRVGFCMHAKIKCVGIHDGGNVAVVAGPADAQNDTILGEGTWMVVEILEGGVGSGDKVRVRLMPEAAARLVCDTPSYSFPATIYDGNFNIRSK